MLYDKHGRQGLLDTEDVGISLDGVRLPASLQPGGPAGPGPRLKGLAAFRDPNDVFFGVFGFREPPKGVALHAAGKFTAIYTNLCIGLPTAIGPIHVC